MMNKSRTSECLFYSCTQRDDRQFSRSNEEASKYEREVRPAIERYPCKGGMTMKIDLPGKRAKISNGQLLIENLVEGFYTVSRT